MSSNTAPYGTWSSPITADAIVKGVNSITDVFVDPVTSKVYHIESRPSEEGRSVLVETETNKDVVGKPWNVRNGVHEYGGASATVQDGTIYFSNSEDGRVYRVAEGCDPIAVTPESKALRYANFVPHPTFSHLIICIVEDHTIDVPSEVVNKLCVISANTQKITTLASRADFYASPQLSPDGTRLTWQQWNHPEMPWEGSEVHVADVVMTSAGLTLKNDVLVGGKSQSISCTFPTWSTKDTIIYTSDESGYSNPWKYANKTSIPILLQPEEIEYNTIQWWLNVSPYTILDEEGRYALFAITREGRNQLRLVDLQTGSLQDIDSPFVVTDYLRTVSRSKHEVVFKAQTVDEAPCIVKCTFSDFSGQTPPTFTVLKQMPCPPISRDYISSPKPMALISPTSGGPIHVVFYEPKNAQYSGSSIEGELPPCILYVHGGPTGLQTQALNWSVQYFTSRGFAWLDLNYGGSSGYGRAYVNRLNGNWGLVDVSDAIESASILSEPPYNLIDPKRRIIRGASAGGYTTLATLANGPNVTTFAAGCAFYGISDLIELVRGMIKLESRYMCTLVGSTPEADPETWKERSPINHIENIVSPLLILQGDSDTVVPKEQAELIVQGVKARGGVIDYVLYPGEGHGFEQEKNLKNALETEMAFYQRIFSLIPDTQ